MPKKLIAEYRRIAALGGNFRGLTVLEHRDAIRELVATFGVKSILDFGSGAGDQYRDPHNVHRYWGIQHRKIRMYDPAFPGLSARPAGAFDAVISSDVLEHIAVADVPEAVEFMFDRARKVVWASVCCRLAKKLFDDGLNMHVTVKPIAWWEVVFKEASVRHGDLPYILVETP